MAETKLTIAQANFHLLWGGQAEVVLALSQELAARGHRLHVISPPGSELAGRARAAGLDVFTGCNFRKGLRPIALCRDILNLRAFLKEKGAQVYHCHGSQDHWTGALSASPGTKIVRTRHNIYPVKNHLFNRWLFRRKTALVITIFGEQKRFFTENGLLSADRLATLHSPLPQEFTALGGTERVVRRELQLPDSAPLVGFAANFHPDKAPLDFVAAARQIAAAQPEAHFCMAGHGPLDEAIRAEAQRAGLGGRLHMLGFRKDIRAVLASLDLLLLTSVAREASSTVLKQAAAVGLPVVATDVGGTREVVEDGQTGILAPAGDVAALARSAVMLLNDRGRAKEMGRAGRQKVLREFTVAAIAEKTEALYHKILTPPA